MKATKFVGTAVVGVAAWLAGCGSSAGTQSAPTTTPTHEHGGMAMTGAMCPMQVPGTTVASADIEGGVALAFTTSTGDVDELRARVRRMGAMHNRRHAGSGMAMGGGTSGGMAMGGGTSGGMAMGGGTSGGMAMGGMSDGMNGGMGGLAMPAATASVDDVAGGARIVLRPNDPTELDALREHVRMHAEQMAHGECPMMAPNAQGQAATPRTTGSADHAAHLAAPPGK